MVQRNRVDAMIIRGVLVLVFLGPLVFAKGLWNLADSPKRVFTQSAILLLTLLWGIKVARHKQLEIRRSPVALPSVLLLLAIVVSLFQAANLYEGLTATIHWAISVLFFFLLVNNIQSPKQVDAIVVACILSGVAVSLIGMAQHLLGFSWIPQLAKPASTFCNKNMAIHFIVMVLPLACLVFVSNSKPSRDWVYGLGWATMGVYLIYTQTRAGWVSVVVSFAIMFTIMLFGGFAGDMKRLVSSSKGGALILLLLLIVAMASIPAKGQRTTKITKRIHSVVQTSDGSAGLRLIWWKNTLPMIRDNFWTGVGIGNFEVHYPLYHRSVETDPKFGIEVQLKRVHNDYLQMVVEVGAIGFLFYIWLLVAQLRMFWSTFRNVTRPDVRLKISFLTMSVLAFMGNSFFTFPLEKALPPVFLFLLFALTSVVYSDARSEKIPPFTMRISNRAAVTALSCFGLIAVGLTTFSIRDLIADAHAYRVRCYGRAGKLNEARVEAEKAERYNPWRYDVRLLLGRVYDEIGMGDDALRQYKRILENYPNSITAILDIGKALNDKESYGEAIRVLSEGLRIKPDFAEALLEIGYAYEKRGSPDKAMASYRQAIAARAGYAEAHNNLGNVYSAEGLLDEAAKEYKQALEIRPRFAGAHYNLGNVHLKRGILDQAVLEYREAVTIKPQYYEAHNNLGNVYFSQRSFSDAITHYTKALVVKPDVADLHLNLGNAYYQQGNHDEALRYYSKAVVLNPEYAQAHYNLAVVYYVTENYKLANKHARVAEGLGYDTQLLMKRITMRSKEPLK